MKKEEVQSYIKREDIIIENNTAKWDISHSGDIQGLYTGTFVFKCFLTPTEKLAAGRNYRELLGNNAVLALKHEDNLAFTLSQLKYRVISGPPFWSSATGMNGTVGDIPDEDVLDTVLEAALSAEFKYLAILQNKREEATDKAKKVAEAMAERKEKEEAEDGEGEGKN